MLPAIALFATALFSSFSFAQSGGTGGIEGKVSNPATKQFLFEAEVKIEGANRSTLTARDGSYRFSGLQPGTYTLTVDYTGLDTVSQQVIVEADRTAQADIELTAEIYKLSPFVVAAETEGNAYALNRRKKAEFMMEAISSDVFGSVTEGNAGEFLKNLPGVQIEYNAADARAMRIRGQDSYLTNVTIDGAQYANASSSNTTRVFEVDQISIHNIESIEVFKAPPPSQSPAIGGTVNLTTKSAFEQKGRRVLFTTNLNANSEDLTLGKTPGPGNRETHKIGIGGTLNYSEAFLGNTLGISLTLSESNQHNEQHSITKGYTFPGVNLNTTQVTADTPGYLSQYQILDGPKFANRRNVGLNIDYKLTNNTTVALKNSFGQYEAQVRDRTFRLRGNTPQAGFSVNDVTFTSGANVRADTGYTFFNKNSRDWSSRLAVKHKLNAYTISYDFGFSKSTNHYNSLPDTARGINLDLPNIGFRLIQPANTADVTVQQTSGPDLFNYANYVISSGTTISDTDRNSGDFILSGQIDAKRDFAAFRFPFYLQTGYAWRQQERSILRPDPNYQHVGIDGIAGTADDPVPAALFQDRLYTNPPGFGLPSIPWGNPFLVKKYWNENPQAIIEGSQAQANSIRKTTSHRFFQEVVNAGYFMGSMRFGNLNVLAGGRVELTDFEAVDYETRPSQPLDQRYVRRKRTVKYDPPVFKNLQLRYNVTPDLVARASYTDGQGRQNFSDLVPSTTYDDTNRRISQNAYGLQPLLSHNYDVSLEYYLKPSGVLSAGWFRKEIKNYKTAYNEIIDDESLFGPEYVGWELRSFANGGDAEYEGVELDYRQRLTFLPGWFKGLELFGNYTDLYFVEGNFGGTTVVTELVDLQTELFNAGVSFTTPNRKLFLQAKLNYNGRSLRSTNAAGVNKQYNEIAQKWDFNVRYTFNPRYALELTVRDAFVNPRRINQYASSYYVQWHEYGAQYSLIFRVRL
jgi:iron complex outermembrane recepter protein